MPLRNTVLVVEDHPIFLKGLAHLLSAEAGFFIAATAANRHQALEALDAKHPDIVLVDLTLGEDSGLELIKDIRFRAPDTRILVLSMHDERFYAERSLSAGAHGYCMKEEAADHIVAALKSVAAGKIWLGPEFTKKNEEFLSSGGWLASVHKLSDREFQVFTLIGKGLGTVEIAAKLHLSAKTIDTHKENIKVKLACSTTQDLRQYAIEWQMSQAKV
ncbi:MAG TPA: response regulator transcription factor [Spirochaetia bacterium]|jgi:DNA-binding NarL/FixJ family response regulator|nr:response regulator transcription factor [Spirochaetia bacterium]